MNRRGRRMANAWNPSGHKHDLLSKRGFYNLIQDAYHAHVEPTFEILTRMQIFYGSIGNVCKFCNDPYAFYYLNCDTDNLPQIMEHMIFHMPANLHYEKQGWMSLRDPSSMTYRRFRNNVGYAEHIIAALICAYHSGGKHEDYQFIRSILKYKPEGVITILVMNYLRNPYYENGIKMTLQEACARELSKPFVLDIVFGYLRYSYFMLHRNKKTRPNFKNMDSER